MLGEDAADEIRGVEGFHSTAAQRAGFCLLTPQSEILDDSKFDKMLARANAEIQKWSELYKEAGKHVEIEGIDSSQ